MPKRNRHRERQRDAHPSASTPTQPGRDGRSAGGPPSGVRRLQTPEDASALAAQLLGDLHWPVVVVSISAAATDPYIDAIDLKDKIGDLGEVVVMPTNEVSWAFSDDMPAMTQVYGGAGRVYGVDGGWRSDPYQSPLRFAYARSDSDRVVEALAKDVAASAFRAGTAWSTEPPGGQGSARPQVVRDGEVQGTIGNSRALVKLSDGTYATIWAELTALDIDITQVVTRGQVVRGVLDPESRRFDVRSSLQPPGTALAGYEAGAAVLAHVTSVAPHAVTLTLFPGVDTDVPRDRVTDNPLDHLEDLFSPAEIVVADLEELRLADSEVLDVTLRLDTVDDDDVPLRAPALLRGGPPWLTPVEPIAPVLPSRAQREPTPSEVFEPETATAPLDSPAISVPVPGPRPSPPRLTPAPSVEALMTEVKNLAQANRALESEISDLKRERESLRTRLRASGSQRRKAERAASKGGSSNPSDWSNLFADPVEQFRFEVHVEWARRIAPGQKAERPLVDYAIGPDFLQSLHDTPSVDRQKVVAVVVEVLTGLAANLDSRDVHALRVNDAGGSKPLRRADGSTCMRVSLQSGTPSARRLHYWSLGSRVELSRVVLHDDMTP